MTAPTITEFITARLDEWEQSAREATPGPWSAADEHGLMPGATPAWCVSQLTPAGAYVQDVSDIPQGGDSEEADARHIALHNPAVILTLVAALRAIVNGHEPDVCEHIEDGTQHEYCEICSNVTPMWDDGPRALVGDEGDWPCPTLRHIAAVWADHPDYDGSWRP